MTQDRNWGIVRDETHDKTEEYQRLQRESNMSTSKQKKGNPIERAADTSLWVERLMELFWACQEADEMKDLSPQVKEAYEAAERARKRL